MELRAEAESEGTRYLLVLRSLERSWQVRIAASSQAIGFDNTTPWSGHIESSFGHGTSLGDDKKPYDCGKLDNVTKVYPPNE